MRNRRVGYPDETTLRTLFDRRRDLGLWKRGSSFENGSPPLPSVSIDRFGVDPKIFKTGCEGDATEIGVSKLAELGVSPRKSFTAEKRRTDTERGGSGGRGGETGDDTRRNDAPAIPLLSGLSRGEDEIDDSSSIEREEGTRSCRLPPETSGERRRIRFDRAPLLESGGVRRAVRDNTHTIHNATDIIRLQPHTHTCIYMDTHTYGHRDTHNNNNNR